MVNHGATDGLLLTRIRATSYRVEDGHNFLVQVRGRTGDGRRIDGLGEAMPRGSRTGDRAGPSWELLAECARRLEGRTLPASDPAGAVAAVRAVLAEFGGLAGDPARVAAPVARPRSPRLPRSRQPKAVARWLVRRAIRIAARAARLVRRPAPFQGTLRGVEAALVDLLARALEQPPGEVFGRRAGRLRANLPLPPGSPPDREVALFERILGKVYDVVAYPTPPAPTHRGRTSTVYDEVPYLKPLGSNGTKGHLLEREALVLGLATTRFSKGAFLATDRVHPPLIFKWSRSPRSSAVSLAMCTHKEATRMRLRRAGVPVPRGRTFGFGDFATAEAFAERIGYPVVVKPAMGVRGIGVVANIRDAEELRAAFDQLVRSRLGKDDFIVEQHITGRDYRIVVVGDEVIAAILREPAAVEGDGEHTVAELMANKNAFRRRNPHLWGRPIKHGDAARYQLERAGLRITSVPGRGRLVLLSNSCSLSQGGESIDVLDELHPSIREACVQAVRAVPGLWFCGIDFLVEDHARPLSEQRAGICELNAHAAIGNCEYPLYGTPRPVARTVLQQCVERFGLSVADKPADRLALRLTIRGRVTRVGYRTWLRRHAIEFGLTGWVRNLGPDAVEAVLVGDAAPASALAAAAVLGPRRASPSSVSTEHIPPPEIDGFEIIEEVPES
jgi:D-alanine-D-alanine ligase-like ATP-grasp enzyme/acylphosphatase